MFALSNGHIGLRGNLDEGDPHGLPGTYLNSVYELRPLPYAEAGYGYPESGQTVINVTNGKLFRLLVDDEPFDVRYGTLDAHERMPRPAGRHARAARSSGRRRPATRIRLARPAWCRSPSGRSRPSSTRSSRSTTPLRIVLQSELVANEELPDRRATTRARPRSLEQPARQRGAHRARPPRPLLVHRTRRSGLRRRRRAWITSSTGPSNTDLDITSSPEDVCRLTIATRPAARRAAARRQVPRLRLVEPADPPGAARPGGRGARGGAAHRLGRPAGRAARLPRRVLGRRRRRDRRRRRGAAGGALRAVPHPAGRRPGRAAPDPGQGPHRSRLRRPHLLGHRDVRAAGAHVHAARPGRRRPALAAAHPADRPGARRRAEPRRRRVPVAHDPRPGVVGLLAGGHRRLPHQRRHRRRRGALPRRHAGRGLRARRGRRAARRDRPAVAQPRPPRPRRARSASTA